MSQLLRVEPPKDLVFRFDQRGRATSTFRIWNDSQSLVAFKVNATNPPKFTGGPSYGILKPRSYPDTSYRDVKVTVHGQVEALSNMQCGDKVIIKSLKASHDYPEESIPRLFKERATMGEDYELRVVYALSMHQQSSNFERSGAGSSRNASTLQETNFSSVEQPDRNRRNPLDLLRNGIIVVFACLVFFYLMVEILSRIWTLLSVITYLLLRMMRNRALDTAEDWIRRTLLYLGLSFLAAVREEKTALQKLVSTLRLHRGGLSCREEL